MHGDNADDAQGVEADDEERHARLPSPGAPAEATTHTEPPRWPLRHRGHFREFGGTALGLALSQKLCHAMGGDIYVESKLGIGSTFIIDLPAAP